MKINLKTCFLLFLDGGHFRACERFLIHKIVSMKQTTIVFFDSHRPPLLIDFRQNKKKTFNELQVWKWGTNK